MGHRRRAELALREGGAGSGALGDLGAHIIDLARYLVGEPVAVTSVVRTFVDGHEVDDAFAATVEFESGAIGTIEASRLARGRINQNTFEVNGSRGSVSFDVERLNELEVADEKSFRRVLVTSPTIPHVVLVAARAHHRLGRHVHARAAPPAHAIAGEGNVAPHGATFEDGYRGAEVCDAILRAAESGRSETIAYRERA